MIYLTIGNGRSLILQPSDLLTIHDQSRKKRTIKCARAGSSQIGFVDFHKTLMTHLLMENQVALICCHGRGTQNKKIFRFGYRYLIVLVFREDHDYCTISAKPLKLGIRSAVKDCLK